MRIAKILSILMLLASSLSSSTASDLAKLQELANSSNGQIVIPQGRFVLDGTWELDLAQLGAISLSASGPCTLIMEAPGPAIRITGTISGSADPNQFTDQQWLERMPLIEGFEIIGQHPEADGIELVRTMQATINRISIRKTRHALKLSNRNRNVVISDVHLYDNSGIGLFLDNVNLHQINVANSHISYNRQGGIVVRGGNVRNLHITGCDIEANMPDDATPTDAANILVDQSMADCSAAEIAITGCTIQHSAHYGKERKAPGGANIRIVGRDDFQPNMISITGNVISDTETHVHLRQVADVTISGNTFFTTEPTDILVEQSQRVIVASSAFNPRESTGTGQILFRDSSECLVTGITTRNLLAGDSAISFERCRDCRVQGCIISGSINGVAIRDGDNCVVSDCTVTGLAKEGQPVVQTNSHP